MPTVILRPISVVSETGWETNPLVMGDGNSATTVTQDALGCQVTFVLEDIDSSLGIASINSFTMSLEGVSSKQSSTGAIISLVHSSDGSFSEKSVFFSGGTTETETTTPTETQSDGSSNLDIAYINACNLKLVPSTAGITVSELFVTVNYTEKVSHAIQQTQGLIQIISGKITL